jgi:hypothetical protein
MSPASYKFLADALVVFHMGFVGFVLLGGTIVLRWRRAMGLHLPAVAWGIYIELSHKICPLTPLENHLRALGGAATYQGGFVDHYIMPVLYPNGLTPAMQVAIAVLIGALNGTIYGWIIAGRRIRDRFWRTIPPAEALPVTPTETDTPAPQMMAGSARNG